MRKSGSYQFLKLTLRASRVTDSAAWVCLWDSHPVYTFPLHTREGVDTSYLSQRGASCAAPTGPYLSPNLPRHQQGSPGGISKAHLKPQIFINNFHKSYSTKSWCLLAARRNPHESHPWIYGVALRKAESCPLSQTKVKAGEGGIFWSRSSSHRSAKLVVKLKSSPQPS